MGAMASQITDVQVVCSTICSGADQRKDQSSVSLAFVRGIHRWPVDSLHKGPVTRKIFLLMTSSCAAIHKVFNLIYKSFVWFEFCVFVKCAYSTLLTFNNLSYGKHVQIIEIGFTFTLVSRGYFTYRPLQYEFWKFNWNGGFKHIVMGVPKFWIFQSYTKVIAFHVQCWYRI